MPRDNLFANQTAAMFDTTTTSTSGFSSPEDLKVARAFTDVLLAGGNKYHVTSLSTLGEQFVAAEVGPQFKAWTHSANVSSAFISADKMEKALTPAFVDEVSKRASLDTSSCLQRLTYVVPFIVSQVAPVELAESPRAFRFNLAELRKRLR